MKYTNNVKQFKSWHDPCIILQKLQLNLVKNPFYDGETLKSAR